MADQWNSNRGSREELDRIEEEKLRGRAEKGEDEFDEVTEDIDDADEQDEEDEEGTF